MNARRAACTALLALGALAAGCSGHSSAQSAPSRYADGGYQVGRDIPAGTYNSNGANASGRCTITTRPHAEGVPRQHRTATAAQLLTITLTEDDGLVTIHGCEPLTPAK